MFLFKKILFYIVWLSSLNHQHWAGVWVALRSGLFEPNIWRDPYSKGLQSIIRLADHIAACQIETKHRERG